MLSNQIQKWIEAKPAFILLPLWLLIQLYVSFRFGVQYHFDSQKYLNYADQFIETGTFSYVHEFWYLGYALWLAIFRLFTDNATFIIIGQVLLSGLATWALYKISDRLSQNKFAPFFTTLLFILWIKGQWWNYFILTESLFISCNILFFFLILKLNDTGENSPNKKAEQIDRTPLIFSYRKLLILLPCLIFTFFIRPVGVLTILVFGIYLLTDFLWNKGLTKKQLLIGLSILGMIAIIGFSLLNKVLNNYWLITAFARGEVICGIFECDLINELDLPENEGTMLGQTAYFIQHNFSFFMEMCLQRMITFWSGIREGFSFRHNLLVGLFLYPVYCLSLIGLFVRCSIAAKAYLLCFILGNALMILITCVNFDGRFISPVLPFVFIFAGMGFSFLWDKINS